MKTQKICLPPRVCHPNLTSSAMIFCSAQHVLRTNIKVGTQNYQTTFATNSLGLSSVHPYLQHESDLQPSNRVIINWQTRVQEVRKHLHTPVPQNQQIQQFKLSLGHVGFLSLNLLNHSSNWPGPKGKANQNWSPRGPDNVLRQWNKINSLSQHPIKTGSQNFGSQTAAPSSPPLHDSISECMHHWSRKLCVQLLDQPQEFLRVKTYFSSRLSGRRYFAYLCHKIPFAASSFAGAVV